VRLGGLYDVILSLNKLPSGVRIAGVPPIAAYHLDVDRFGNVDWRTPVDSAAAAAADYIVVRRGDRSVRPENAAPPLLETPDGFVLVATDREPNRSSDLRAGRP